MDAQPGKEVASPLVPVQRRIIEWDAEGNPILAAVPVLTKQHLTSLYFIAAAQPFVCDDPLDPDFGKYDGLTCAEVMVRKQIEDAAKSGDVQKIETVMDRLIGKPVNRGENVNVHASYEDFLKGVAARSVAEGPVIDVQPVEPASIFGDLGV